MNPLTRAVPTPNICIPVSSRSGINQTPESLEQLDQLVSPFLLKGQPLSHIYASNQHLIDCSIRTLYNYIDHGYFTAINLDLPRKVRYKKRRKTRKAPENTGYRENRTYHHFEKYLEEYPDTNVVELDVVEGAGGKSEKGEHIWKIQGGAILDDVAEAINVELPVEKYDTFSGFVCGVLERVPELDGRLLWVPSAGI